MTTVDSTAQADVFEFGWTEPGHQLPGYVNLKRDGGPFKLTVRQHGQQYGQTIELPDHAVDSMAVYLCRPELVSDEEAERGGQAIEQAVEKAWHRLCLENCRLFAARHREEEWAQTILRFCAEAGVSGSPLRVTATAAQR